jgi:hypothetical protein
MFHTCGQCTFLFFWSLFSIILNVKRLWSVLLRLNLSHCIFLDRSTKEISIPPNLLYLSFFQHWKQFLRWAVQIVVFRLDLFEIVGLCHLCVILRDYVTTIMTRLIYRHPRHLPLKSSLTPTSDIDSASCRTLFLPRCDRSQLHQLSSSMIMLVQIRSWRRSTRKLINIVIHWANLSVYISI